MTSDLAATDLQTTPTATNKPSDKDMSTNAGQEDIKGKGKQPMYSATVSVSDPSSDLSVDLSALIAEGKQALALNETEKAVDLFGNASAVL